jgi:uncharacterized protein YoxC
MSEAEERQRPDEPTLSAVDNYRPQPGGGDLGGGGNVDKIRDILFGTQMRDYEKRFARLEERLLKESADLREDSKRRFAALEALITKELEALTDRLKAEQGERAESVEEVSHELRNLTKSFEKKSAQLEEQTAKGQRDLRQQILEQSKTLSDDIRQKHEELSSLLGREVEGLSTEKADRATLAALFTEVAMRLNNEFKIPGND